MVVGTAFNVKKSSGIKNVYAIKVVVLKLKIMGKYLQCKKQSRRNYNLLAIDTGTVVISVS